MAEIHISFVGDKRDLNKLLLELFESSEVEPGMSKDIPGGAVITLEPMKLGKGIAAPHAVDIIVGLAMGVSSSLIAAYLYDKFKSHGKRGTRMLIERREFRVTKSGMTKIIEERIEAETDDE